MEQIASLEQELSRTGRTVQTVAEWMASCVRTAWEESWREQLPEVGRGYDRARRAVPAPPARRRSPPPPPGGDPLWWGGPGNVPKTPPLGEDPPRRGGRPDRSRAQPRAAGEAGPPPPAGAAARGRGRVDRRHP